MKVLWLVSSYPRWPGDSASIFLHHLAKALEKEGIEIHIVLPDHLKIDHTGSSITLHPFRYFIPRKSQELAYGSGILPNLRSKPRLYTQIPPFLAGMWIKTQYLCRALEPDLIHAHWILPQGTIATLAGKMYNIPVLVTAHGGDAFAFQNGWLQRLKQWTLLNADAWTTNARATAKATGSTISPEVIPMGVNFDQFSKAAPGSLLDAKNNDRIVLFVGRLVEKKGVSDLISAFSKLSSLSRLQLWIVGEGEQRRKLENLTTSLGIEKRVHFWGRIPNVSLPSYYAAADLFVAPSVVDPMGDTEGQGVVFLEAMASGTAVIATHVGGIGEVIENRINGLLVSPNNPDELYRSMEQLLSDDTLRSQLARQGQETAKAYHWTTIAQRFFTLYKRLIHDRKLPAK